MIGTLNINLKNLQKNWSYINKFSNTSTETGAVIKADAYGLGVTEIATALWEVGNRSFFVATVEEGINLKKYYPSQKK